MDVQCIVYLYGLLFLGHHVTGYSYTGERSIRSSVLNSFAYDNMARPNDSTTAYVGFNLLVINDVDIDIQSFVCTGWFTVLWNDERLSWRPEIYDDTTYIHALENELWKPEVLILNAQENVGLVSDDHLIYRIHNTGNVEWEPLMTMTVHCEIDVTYYPFDTQICQLELTSWGLPLAEMKLTPLWTTVNLDSYKPGPSWNILNTQVKEGLVIETLNGTAESFSQLIFRFTIRRKSGNYVFTTIVPIVLSSLLMPCSMLLPVECAERITSGFLVLVINAVLMTIFMQQIPDIATTSSVLGFFISGSFVLDNIFLLLSVILTSFCYKHKNQKLGHVTSMFVRFLLRVTCFQQSPKIDDDTVKPEGSMVYHKEKVLDIPTDDLKKVHRACADGAGTCSVNRNWVHPAPTFEDGFTEHVIVKETNLPSIYPNLNLNLMKLHQMKSANVFGERSRHEYISSDEESETNMIGKGKKVNNDANDANDEENEKKTIGKGKKVHCVDNNEENETTFEQTRNVRKTVNALDDEHVNEKGKLYLQKIGKGYCEEKEASRKQSTSESMSGSYPNNISYQNAVAVFDRILFVFVVVFKIFYNVILIGNLVSTLSVDIYSEV